MATIFEQRLDLVSTTEYHSQFSQINRGIEKEGLRTTAQGGLAQTPHPLKLGSALTHPCITTDYSEALLEFITPVFTTPEKTIDYLSDIHRYCYSQLNQEFIWATSMPCFLGGEEAIPIARYGSSNIGMLKHVYRIGLAHRYGKMMQTIAGIHYNFSLPETFWAHFQQSLKENDDLQTFQTDQYFALIRNFRRYSWLILYLFGASPALCPSFLQGRNHRLENLTGNTLYAPYGTSLRMGDLGYQNNAQQHLHVCYNSLDDYVSTLGQAIHTPHADYERIGVKGNGQYRQLNTNVLQIENEYYSDIRPKRVTPSGQKPLHELSENGVQYIEVRNIDINPFLPAGIDSTQARFLDCFLLYCLLEESPYASDEECLSLNHNKSLVINRGREPDLMLNRWNNKPQKLTEWGNELFGKLSAIAAVMDHSVADNSFSSAVAQQHKKLTNPDATPSARIIKTLQDQNISFFEFALQQTKVHGEYFKAHPLPASESDGFQKMAQDSHKQQSEIEASDNLSFDEYLRQYMAS
ncbi:MAG: glutamate--cysteine ligase [Pseudomonadales bacterium]|nr:glutamate--cysteine ligase [Pseudomonadales bacterium]